MDACPVGTEAGRYVSLIAEGRYEEAYRVARRPNPFASVCGRICAAPCEIACRRGEYDDAIAIRALKRFVTERYGVESLIDFGRLQEAAGIVDNGKYVAVVGAGPAGMTAAHDLRLQGYQVTVFEKQEIPGGMLRLGIPEYRLPRELLRMEINAILSLGVELKTGAALGRDFRLDDLRENGFDAVFLAYGAHKSRHLHIPGTDLNSVHHAVEFLVNSNMGNRVQLGERIVVVGGGNVALDIARTAARQESGIQPTSDITSALDVARSAVRFGAREVTAIALESPEEIPADLEEITQAREENIRILYRKGPNRILGQNGRVTGIETIDVASVFDAQGRFNPEFIEGTEQVIPADSVIIAIGQQPDLSPLSEESGLEKTPRNTLKVDPETLSTTSPGIFAGGDLAFGPRNAIDAVADGQRVARAINETLSDTPDKPPAIQVRVLDSVDFSPPRDFDTLNRQPVPHRSTEQRTAISEVELGYDETIAQREASRCLKCWINTVFEGNERPEWGDECILCGMCVDICPEDCIELVSGDRLDISTVTAEENSLARELEEQYGMRLFPVAERDQQVISLAMMVKDETICIRCGLCARRCPVQCITLEAFLYEYSPQVEAERIAV